MEKPYESTPATEAAAALQELQSLPTLADTKVQVQAAIDQITAAATALIPTAVWRSADNADTGNCQHPYEQTGGKREFLPNRVADAITVSEQDWVKIAAEAERIAAGLGATDIAVMKNSPGNHDVWFTGPTGLFIKLSYSHSLVVAGYTGCRL